MWTHSTSYGTERPQWCQEGLKALFLGRAGLLWTIYLYSCFLKSRASWWQGWCFCKSLVAGTAIPWAGSRPLAQGIPFPQKRPCSVMLWQLPARGKQGWKNAFSGGLISSSLIGLVSTVTWSHPDHCNISCLRRQREKEPPQVSELSLNLHFWSSETFR